MGFYETFQSAYKPHHSTEMAFLRFQANVVAAFNRQIPWCHASYMKDLSATVLYWNCCKIAWCVECGRGSHVAYIYSCQSPSSVLDPATAYWPVFSIKYWLSKLWLKLLIGCHHFSQPDERLLETIVNNIPFLVVAVVVVVVLAAVLVVVQPSSSLWSLQSGIVSHLYLSRMHSPSAQVNLFDPHVLCATEITRCLKIVIYPCFPLLHYMSMGDFNYFRWLMLL